MHIRCFCGNDTMLHDGEDGQPRLYDRKWFDADNNVVRCPKCGSDALAITLAGEAGTEGPIPVRIDTKAAFAKRRIEMARAAAQAKAEAEAQAKAEAESDSGDAKADAKAEGEGNNEDAKAASSEPVEEPAKNGSADHAIKKSSSD